MQDTRVGERLTLRVSPGKSTLKRLSGEDIRRIEQHKRWLDSDGHDGSQLYIADAHWSNADLNTADLRKAAISGNLRGADLRGARLNDSDLRGAILWDADLREADLTGAVGLQRGLTNDDYHPLSGANLAGAKGIGSDRTSFPELANLTEIYKNASAMFLALIAVDAVVQIMALKAADAQLVLNSGTVTTPFLAAEVPTLVFMWIGPLLLLLNYLGLLFHMNNLWSITAQLPAVFPDGVSLPEKLYPWMAADITVRHFRRLREQHRPQSQVSARMFTWLIYTTVPLSTLIQFFSFLKARYWFSIIEAILFAAMIGARFLFLHYAKGRLERRAKEESTALRRRQMIASIWGSFQVASAAAVLIYVYCIAVRSVKYPIGFKPSFIDFFDKHIAPVADLSSSELSERPRGWTRNNDKNYDLIRVPANLKGRNLNGANCPHAFLAKANLEYASARHVDLTGADLTGADLTGADLTGANLTGANLTGANLTAAKLKGVSLKGMKLNGMNFAGANLRGMDMSGADLTGANLSGADLTEADLSDAELTGADLTNAHITHANLTGASLSYANLNGMNFTGTNLAGAYLTFSDLTNAHLQGANLTEAHFTDVVFTNADLSNADLKGSYLTNANLTNANLKNSNLESAHLNNANLLKANLTNADLMYADFTCANLTGANFTHARIDDGNFTNAHLAGANLKGKSLDGTTLSGADLSMADLTDAVLTGADLTDADLTDANLTQVLLREADLRGAILNRADLFDATLTDAKYNRDTVWPVGFNPRKHDLIFRHN